jgi:cell division protein FtsI/penicillin-binding protein 2
MNYRSPRKTPRNPFKNLQIDRNLIFFIVVGIFSAIIVVRLFELQVLAHDHYAEVAAKEHYGYSELPAHRGEIFIKDYASGENVRIATNSTLDLLYADPTLIKDKKLVTDRIVPLIYNLDEAKQADQERVKTAVLRAKTSEELAAVKPYTDDELYQNFYNQILDQISSDIRPRIILGSDLTTQQVDGIKALNLTGIEIDQANELIAYPPQITDLTNTAQSLGTLLQTPPLQLEALLRGKNRYVVLKRKLTTEISTKIKETIDQDKGGNFSGLGLTEEYYRYYPEGQLASNVLGFVTPTGDGSYGIEAKFNTELRGKKGVFETQKDSVGRQITVGDSLIQPAEDGKNIVLTLDRSVQLAVESRLKKAVEDYRADSGQVIVMDPKTGRILAMADYPSFDPNDYGTVYEKDEIKLTPEQISGLVPVKDQENTFWLYRSLSTEDRLMIFKSTLPDGTVIYEHYKNNIGPEAYQNKIVSEPYEPGSVFKTVVMSIGLDDGDVTPSTAINDSGVLKVDEYEIHDVSGKCTGHITMANVLAQSCNTGMGWLAQKLGRQLFYNYLMRYGFGNRTEIEFDNENPGQIAHFSQWADSELATHAFGQGLTATVIQMAEALSVMANKGVMMQPFIVDSVEKTPGNWVTTEPTILGQIIKPETAQTMIGLMVGAVENGVSHNNAMPDYYIAAKTGTSQTYRNGKPLSGVGTTIATVGGFGPINNPRFVILAKLDRPRSSEWADTTTSNLFKSVAEYMFSYYSIPPDKK